MIARHDVAQKLNDYLHHRLGLEEIVNWAEAAMMDKDFDPADFETIRDIVARIGLANVRAFGLTWEDCEDFLRRLGYTVHLDVIPSR
jgi:cobyrinic acid a,c-diamide synthase